MHIELISARNPVENSDGTITLQCKFSHLGDVEVPFTASPNDSEEHGKAIYMRALAHEFGEIVEYMPPSTMEIAEKASPQRRTKEMVNAKKQVEHYALIDDDVMMAAWKQHYKDLHNLADTEWWPLVEEWPVAPE